MAQFHNPPDWPWQMVRVHQNHHHHRSIHKPNLEFKNKGRAVSMTRLDQLAQPTRRKGEHIRAVIERERKEQIESNFASERATAARKMSRSLTHLSSSSSTRSPVPLKLHQFGRNSSSATKYSNQVRPLRKSNATKSMTQLVTAKLLSTPKTPTVVQARNAQKHANDTEIDSRTTNVSAGVCVCVHHFRYLSLSYLALTTFIDLMQNVIGKRQ